MYKNTHKLECIQSVLPSVLTIFFFFNAVIQNLIFEIFEFLWYFVLIMKCQIVLQTTVNCFSADNFSIVNYLENYFPKYFEVLKSKGVM